MPEIVDIKSSLDKVKQGLIELDVSPNIALNLIKRLKSRNLRNDDETKAYTAAEIIDQIEIKKTMLLDNMDNFSLANAGLKETALAFGIMVDKARLLKGEPTQIISTEERKALPDIMEMFLIEATRRGITIDHNPTSYEDEEGVDVTAIIEHEA